eukprot:129669_1
MLETVINCFSSDRNSITTTNSTNRDSSIIKNKTRTPITALNNKPTTKNPTHINYQQNSLNLILIIVFPFFIICILIESYMAFSKPNKPINSIIIANNWIVTEPFIVFTTRRRKCIKDKCAPWIENITIIERQLRGDLPREFVEARITISLAYEYIQDTMLPIIVKLKTKFISEKTTKIMTDQVTPTQVLKLERLWREFKPSGTPQNVRRLKLTLNPQKYKKEDDDINMDEDQNGSNNVLDLNNWQHRYDGIYGITNTFSGSKNSEIFPSTWNVNGQLIPNKKDQQKLPASSDPMGSDQH